MELRHISLFRLIYEHRSVSKAARASGLSQPTVSQHLKSLEEELRTPLFDRSGRRLLPTPAAQVLYPYARRVLDLLDRAKGALEEHLGVVRGELWIAGSTIPGHYILPGLIGAFHQRFSQVRVHLRIGDTRWVVECLRSQEVELGFVGARLAHPGLSFHPFAREELILVAAPRHPMTRRRALRLEELPSVPLLSREQGSGTRANWERVLQGAGLDPERMRIVAELGSTEAIVRGVRSGMGAAVVSSRAVEEELRVRTLVRIPLDGPSMERTFYLVKAANRPISVAARAFEDFAMASVAAETTSSQ